MLWQFDQLIPHPYNVSNAANGFDMVVPGNWSGGADSLLFYHRVSGRARFYALNAAQNAFVNVKNHAFKRVWDEVASGDFNGDGVDDLVLYNQHRDLPNTDGLKVVYFDSNYDLTGTDLLPHVGMSHAGRLAVGNFYGSATQDEFIIYQQDGGLQPDDSYPGGRARLFDRSSGTWSATLWTGWSPQWTHFVPVDLGAPRTSFLLYRNLHPINVKIVFASTVGTPQPVSSFLAANPNLSTALQEAQAHAIRSFRAAGIEFSFDYWPQTVVEPIVGSYECFNSVQRAHVINWLNTNGFPTTSHPVIIRPGGRNCGSVYFAALNQDNAKERPNLLLHELGHSFYSPDADFNWHSTLPLSEEQIDIGYAGILAYLDNLEDTLDRPPVPTDLVFGAPDLPPILPSGWYQLAGAPDLRCAEGTDLTFYTPDTNTEVRVPIEQFNPGASIRVDDPLVRDGWSYPGGNYVPFCRPFFPITREQARRMHHSLYRYHLPKL